MRAVFTRVVTEYCLYEIQDLKAMCQVNERVINVS